MAKSREQVLEQIKRLLNMTTERGCTENEAASAAVMVQNLLFKYKLSIAEVKDLKDEELERMMEGEIIFNIKAHEGQWRAQLLSPLARYNFCGLVYSSKGKHAQIIGKLTEIEVVKELHAWLIEQLERCCYWAVKEYHGPDRTPTFKRSFYQAAVMTINSRLYQQFKTLTEETTQSTALVVTSKEEIQQYKDKHYGPLDTKNWSASNGSYAGTRAGIEAGRNADLTPPRKRLRDR